MAKITFNDETIKKLSKSKAISKITAKSITYTKEFKVAIAVCKNILKSRKFLKNGVLI